MLAWPLPKSFGRFNVECVGKEPRGYIQLINKTGEADERRLGMTFWWEVGRVLYLEGMLRMHRANNKQAHLSK